MGKELTIFELNKYEYIRASEELEILRFNIINEYKELLRKLEKELPRYLIYFIEDDFVVDSEFSIYDNTMDITDPREIAHDITYKGVNYRLIGHKEKQYKINKVIDDYFKDKYE